MFLILLGCLGLTWILKYGTILDVPRKIITDTSPLLKDLFECSMCLGFWSGIFWTLILNVDNNTHLLLPFVSSAFCYFSDTLLNFIGSNTKH